MTAWMVAALSIASVPFLVCAMALAFAAVFDLLDLTRPQEDRMHALRSLFEAVTGKYRRG